MLETNDKNIEVAKNILTRFAQYGYQKTSMGEIASASGVSRQSIYKKFGSKENCYDWAINIYLSNMYSKIFTLLANDSTSPKRTLLAVFDHFIGEAITVVHNPHGAQVFKDTVDVTYASQEDWPLRFRTRLADFLELHNYATRDRAKGMAFALISAGKGLLLEESSREQFSIDIRTIIDSLCFD